MKVKVKDIAKAAGVSPTTVSLVLNNRPSRISEETREKILRTAAEMRLKQEDGFESAEFRQVRTIGMVIPSAENPFFQALADAACEYAARKGYILFCCRANDDIQNLHRILEALAAKSVDGAVIVPPRSVTKENAKLLRAFSASGIPQVLLDRAAYNVFCDFVTADNKTGGCMAAEYFIARGHRKIGCIMGEKHLYTSRSRINGYCEALAAAHIPFDENLVKYGAFDAESGKKAAEALMQAGATAIFAGNDQIAYGVYQYAAERGIKIPEDISVIGYDNTGICGLLAPALTSIDQSSTAMAQKAVELLIRRIEESEDETDVPHNYYFTPSVKERDSVRTLTS